MAQFAGVDVVMMMADRDFDNIVSVDSSETCITFSIN